MQRFAPALALLLLACSSGAKLAHAPAVTRLVPAPRLSWPAGLPVYDHIVIVVEENKDYEEIVGNPAAPFLNQLKKEGADLTRMYGEEHNSEGNYFWLFSGSNQGVLFKDEIPVEAFSTSNLGVRLIAAEHSFKGYSEDLPSIGSKVAKQGLYARKHVPWISFANLPDGKTAEESVNLRFQDFPTDFTRLPTVSFVIPNLLHDMHDDEPRKPRSGIPNGDAWLKKHLRPYYEWAKTNNSLLIVTFDEDNHGLFRQGLTDPAAPNPKGRNRIVTLLAGAHVKRGEYSEGKGVTHVNLLRTLEAMYGLERSGDQQPFAARAGISDDFFLTDVFDGGA